MIPVSSVIPEALAGVNARSSATLRLAEGGVLDEREVPVELHLVEPGLVRMDVLEERDDLVVEGARRFLDWSPPLRAFHVPGLVDRSPCGVEALGLWVPFDARRHARPWIEEAAWRWATGAPALYWEDGEEVLLSGPGMVRGDRGFRHRSPGGRLWVDRPAPEGWFDYASLERRIFEGMDTAQGYYGGAVSMQVRASDGYVERVWVDTEASLRGFGQALRNALGVLRRDEHLAQLDAAEADPRVRRFNRRLEQQGIPAEVRSECPCPLCLGVKQRLRVDGPMADGSRPDRLAEEHHGGGHVPARTSMRQRVENAADKTVDAVLGNIDELLAEWEEAH